MITIITCLLHDLLEGQSVTSIKALEDECLEQRYLQVFLTYHRGDVDSSGDNSSGDDSGDGSSCDDSGDDDSGDV